MVEHPHHSPSEKTGNDWEPCPPGTIGRLVGKLKRRQHMRLVKQVAAAAGCLLALVVLGQTLLSTNDAAPEALSHQEVVQLADDYIQGKLDAEQTRLVEAHIDICPQCRHLREDRQAYLERQGAHLHLRGDGDSSRLVARSADFQTRRP